MHSHYSLGIVGNEGETVLHAMEACLTTICQSVFHGEVVFLTQLFPILLLSLRQDEDNLEGRGVLAEPLQCPHQYRFPTKRHPDTTVIIIESMKMELEIKAGAAGKVHFIAATGSQIAQGATLAEVQ